MTDFPDAPWRLVGEAVVGLAPLRGRPVLPPGIRPLGLPAVVGAVRYSASPVGGYSELFVSVPARMGARVGLCVVLMVVDHSGSRAAGRLAWGFPKELGALRWSRDAGSGVRRLTWEERGISVEAAAARLPAPFVLPMRNLQRRADGNVVVPGRVGGMARYARVLVDVPAGDDLAWSAGSHRGAVVSGLSLLLQPARHPSGLMKSLVAPVRAADTPAEPA